MNLEDKKSRLHEAKKVSIYSFLTGIGIKPVIETGSYYIYNSPLRSESQASFNVSKSKNSWKDYGNGNKGDLPDLVMQMYGKPLHGAIDIILGTPKRPDTMFVSEVREKDAIEIIKVEPLSNPRLLDYVESRKINRHIAELMLKEATIRFPYSKKNPLREHLCLAWRNDSGGYELRNSFLKVSNSPKNITTIKSGNDGAVLLFEGNPDFLSYLTYYKIDAPPHPTIVLNSLSFLGAIIPMLQGKTVVFWGQSDKAGEKSFKRLRSEGINLVDKRFIYRDYKDLNQFLVASSTKKLHKILGN